MIKLGLIGDNIARSQSPRLHRLAGRLCGLDVSYEPLVPAELGRDFNSIFDHCMSQGFKGINVTYPYKEMVVRRIVFGDPLAKTLGACNTVLFGGEHPSGFNTDCSGFSAAFRSAFGNVAPGRVAMAGAGGVGKAIAFALVRLGAAEVLIFDPDRAKADGLAASLQGYDATLRVRATDTIAEAVEAADGLVNSTPLGMVGYPGSAFSGLELSHVRWAFDAVYTPVETEFVRIARGSGVQVLSGYELFFYQGVHAFKLFTGCDVDETRLRAALSESEEAPRIAS